MRPTPSFDRLNPIAAFEPPANLTPSDEARAVFVDRLELAERYAARLASDGVAQGHLGPREVARLWDRHLVNSAVLTDLVPVGAPIVDVGTGAGLPGIAMAIRRPDLHVTLVEPMLRRTRFLTTVLSELALTETVRVVRGRAEEPAVLRECGGADWVVARAVAPLDRLVKWCLPLLAPGGRLLALKGSTATSEVESHRAAMRRSGAGVIDILPLGSGLGAERTWAVSVQRLTTGSASRRKGSKR